MTERPNGLRSFINKLRSPTPPQSPLKREVTGPEHGPFLHEILPDGTKNGILQTLNNHVINIDNADVLGRQYLSMLATSATKTPGMKNSEDLAREIGVQPDELVIMPGIFNRTGETIVFPPLVPEQKKEVKPAPAVKSKLRRPIIHEIGQIPSYSLGTAGGDD